MPMWQTSRRTRGTTGRQPHGRTAGGGHFAGPSVCWVGRSRGAGLPARPRLGLAVTAVVAGLIGLAASLVGLDVGIMPRHFTASEQQKIISWEVGKRWRTWPAGEIFPAAVTYQIPATNLASDTGLTLTARRVGIAPEASCATVTDTAAAGLLARHGCAAVLRATYVDATGAFVTTVGVAVLPSARAAMRWPPRCPARALCCAGGPRGRLSSHADAHGSVTRAARSR